MYYFKTMFRISKISKKCVSNLFLAIFTSFLLISIAHSHEYNISVLGNQQIHDTSTETNSDPFLDANYTCIIHSFSNLLSLDFDIYSQTNQQFSCENNIEFYKSHISNLFLKTSNLLRAPPKYLV